MSSLAPDKEERGKCWAAREAFFNCLDEDPSLTPENCPPCEQLRDNLKSTCPPSWVELI
jgi:hypothetical protein